MHQGQSTDDGMTEIMKETQSRLGSKDATKEKDEQNNQASKAWS